MKALRPDEWLCSRRSSNQRCEIMSEREIYYVDTGHLSNAGARLILTGLRAEFFNVLSEQLSH